MNVCVYECVKFDDLAMISQMLPRSDQFSTNRFGETPINVLHMFYQERVRFGFITMKLA